MAVHQLLPDLQRWDAISNYARSLRKFLVDAGNQSTIYAARTDQAWNEICQPADTASFQPDDILIFHYSIDSHLVDEYIAAKCKKVLIYHNITPFTYFNGVNDKLAQLLKYGRERLPILAGDTVLALGDSEYNRLELDEAGFKKTGVMPIIIDFADYDVRPRRKIIRKYGGEATNILFVGRVAPNKRHEDILRVFYYYQKMIDAEARLFLVGSHTGTDAYLTYLRRLVTELKLKDVFFCGAVKLEDLVAYYKVADVFLSMSRHEGFCVPLLESMHFDVPIVALGITAVPGTLGGAGVLVNEANTPGIAELTHQVAVKGDLRDRVVAGQRKRLGDFNPDLLATVFIDYIKQVAS
jgi:L-malate glycosyltransferase